MWSRARRVRRARRRTIGCRCGRLRSNRSLARWTCCWATDTRQSIGPAPRAAEVLGCSWKDLTEPSRLQRRHSPATINLLSFTLSLTRSIELGNVGKTVFYTDPVDANPVNQTESLKELVADMRARQSRYARHSGRQSGLRRARRLRLRRRAQEYRIFRCASISAFIRTRPPSSATGT